jgi:hypothetical protein
MAMSSEQFVAVIAFTSQFPGLGYGLDYRDSIPVRGNYGTFFRHLVQALSGVHPTASSMGIGGFNPKGKMVQA